MHATIRVNDEHKDAPPSFYDAFRVYVNALFEGNGRVDYLDDPLSAESQAYHGFWAQYNIVGQRWAAREIDEALVETSKAFFKDFEWPEMEITSWG